MEERSTRLHSVCLAVLCLSHCSTMKAHGRRGQNYAIGFSIITMAETDQLVIKIVSYNLHGLNNGRSGLSELCNDPNVDIISYVYKNTG